MKQRNYPCIVVHSVGSNLYAATFLLTEERLSAFYSGPFQDVVFEFACEFASYLLIDVYDEVNP